MRFYSTILLIFLYLISYGQIDHYETIIQSDDTWKYLIGTSEPDSDWTLQEFDDDTWLTGIGGFGYGDGDDSTTIPNSSSLYLRKDFDLDDINIIEQLIFCLDYDDAFVAYINGNEIARMGIDGNPPTFDQFGQNHEAIMKSGGNPEQFIVNKDNFKAFLQEQNTLAIQVHNASASSSDMSAIPFLIAARSESDAAYRETPSWFIEPISFTSSDLPIVIINTEKGASIVDEPKTKATMKIIHNASNEINYLNDTANIYNGIIGIEIRGSYSSRLPQKPYGLETRDTAGENLNIPLFQMPKENDWILLANYNDKVMMRNTLSFHLFNQMGHYAPRTQYCELYLNDSYEGIYLLTEKIKQDDGRVNIAKLDSADNSGDEVTGGYIFKIDYFTNEDSWLSSYSPIGQRNERARFVYHDPKADEITSEQKSYIQDYINAFEEILYSSDFDNKLEGYPAYIDVKSFIDYFIMGEITRNVDAYKKSKYYHKDKDSKGGLIHSGPVWDYDWAYKNIHGGGMDGSGWIYTNTFTYPTCDGWIVELMEDTWFEKQAANRYHRLRQTLLSDEYLHAFIDSQYVMLSQATDRHYARWPILGINVGTPENEYQPVSYEEEITKFKNWIDTRLTWLDYNMPPIADDVEDIFKGEGVNSLTQHKVLLRVFPNPTSDYIFVEAEKMINELIVYNTMGKIVAHRTNINKFSVRLDFKEPKRGIHLVKVVFDNHQYRITKVVVK